MTALCQIKEWHYNIEYVRIRKRYILVICLLCQLQELFYFISTGEVFLPCVFLVLYRF